MTTTTIPAAIAESLFWLNDGEKLPDGTKRIRADRADEGRWHKHFDLIFEDTNGRFWSISYSLGLAEDQENELPWNDGDVEAVRVYPHTITRVEYRTEPA